MLLTDVRNFTNITEQFSPALSFTAGGNYIHDVTRRGITGNDNNGISPYDIFSYTPEFQSMNHLNPDGTWPEDATTGTGFPTVFYLTYAMYRDYFPLLALALA